MIKKKNRLLAVVQYHSRLGHFNPVARSELYITYIIYPNADRSPADGMKSVGDLS